MKFQHQAVITGQEDTIPLDNRPLTERLRGWVGNPSIPNVTVPDAKKEKSLSERLAGFADLLINPLGSAIQNAPLAKRLEANVNAKASAAATSAKQAVSGAVDSLKGSLFDFGSGALKGLLIVGVIALVAFLSFKFLVKKVERMA